MSGLNKVMLIGRIGTDPELRSTSGGQNVCSVNMATSEKNKKTGEEKTEWHRLVFWNEQAKLISQYCTKGSQLYVEGKLCTRSWDDNNGNKKYVTEIVVYQMHFLGGSRKDLSQQPQQPQQPQQQQNNNSDNQPNYPFIPMEDDLPF